MEKTDEAFIREEVDRILFRLHSLAPSGTELSKKLVSTYFLTSSERIENVKKAVTHSQWERVKKELHDLKSTSLNMGAQYLGDEFRKLEVLNIQHDVSLFLELFSKAEIFFGKLKTAFRDEIRER